MIVWLTGNSGSGKTTLADNFRKTNPEWIKLDGDEMRWSISESAGFSQEDREAHNLRVARLAKVLHEQGHNVIISVIAPFTVTRLLIDQVIDCKWIRVDRTLPIDKERPYEKPLDVPFIDNDALTEEAAVRLLESKIYD